MVFGQSAVPIKSSLSQIARAVTAEFAECPGPAIHAGTTVQLQNDRGGYDTLIMSGAHISPERKVLYYLGMALTAIGVILFGSTFFESSKPSVRHDPSPGDPNFWEKATADHEAFKSNMKSQGNTAITGLGLCVIGGILMGLGKHGAAGSGLVLDPGKAREDLKPWSKMKGGMVDDALSEVKAVENLSQRLGGASVPEIKVRCQKCRRLNEEDAKFCDQCGAPL